MVRFDPQFAQARRYLEVPLSIEQRIKLRILQGRPPMAETVDSIIVSLSKQGLVAAMTNEKYQPYFAAHTELQDASHIEGLDGRDALCAASVEIAKVLTVFDGQIGDDWRHTLIMLGGALIRLDRELDGKHTDG